MHGATVSGRPILPSASKEARAIAPETSGQCGVAEHAVTRADRFGEVLCSVDHGAMAWRGESVRMKISRP